MSRKFITQREVDFGANVTKELMQGVIDCEVRYYAIDLARSDVNHLYEEAIYKSWRPPVAISALAAFDQASTVAGRFSLDSQYSAEIYFHKKELDERNVVAQEGDFIEWGGIFYEITSATKPQLFYGQINNRVMVKCVCKQAREGQFAAGGDSDRTHRTEKNIENTQGQPPINPLNGPTDYAVNPLRSHLSGTI